MQATTRTKMCGRNVLHALVLLADILHHVAFAGSATERREMKNERVNEGEQVVDNRECMRQVVSRNASVRGIGRKIGRRESIRAARNQSHILCESKDEYIRYLDW